MTKRFTVYCPDSYGYTYAKSILDNQNSKRIGNFTEIVNFLNAQHEEITKLKHQLSKTQSKYDKSKTDEVKVLVETESTVLLDKNEFEEYVRRHNELKRRNKRRKEKNRKYRKELKKRLREINGLKDFVQEDLSRDDKVLKGFIEEYL